MKDLTEDRFKFYKSQDCWNPLDAAFIVCRIDPASLNYNWLRLPEKVRKIYKKSVVDFNNGKIQSFDVINITEKKQITLLQKYCPEFCQKNDSENLDMVYFHPCDYIEWIFDSQVSGVPSDLCIAGDSKTGYCWRVDPDGNINKSNFNYKQVKPGFQPISRQKAYEKMKRRDCWTLGESIILLRIPLAFTFYSHKKLLVEETVKVEDIEPYISAIQVGSLRPIDFNKNDAKSKDWEINFTDLLVLPFEFLEFVKEKDLFEIPPELDFVKKVSKSGEIEYSWVKGNVSKSNLIDAVLFDDLLLNSRKETDILYNSLKQVLKLKNKGTFETCSEDVKEAFRKRPQNYKILIPEDINSEIDNLNNPTRDIKGKLILNIIQRIMPEVFIDKKISTDYQSLYQRSSKLKKRVV